MKHDSCKFIAWLIGGFCYLLTMQLHAQNQQQTTNQLNKVKEAIHSEKVKIQKITKNYQQLENQLKKDDLAIAKSIKQLNQTNKQIKTNENTIKKLNAQQQALTQQKKQHETLLAKQLQTAYTAGDYDYLKLLFNQEKSSEVQRTLKYYQYLNDARIKEITEFQAIIANLLEVVTLQQTKKKELIKLKEQQKDNQATLTANKKNRQKTIAQLQTKLSSTKQKLNELEAQENNLQNALDRLLAEAKKSVEFSGLAKLYKKLRWPVKGKIKRNFGSRKQGYLRWKGVLISAPLGKTVDSIYHGKVIFADWLKGYGLVTVVDHGKGYMSLYGHNQALLKSVGDTVEAGEPIALVGQSGGQNHAGLYFEIRHKGKALNPKKWCR